MEAITQSNDPAPVGPDDAGRAGSHSSLVTAAAGAAAFFVPLALYVFTLAPTVTLEDSGSFIAAAYHLGVAHPPGYPLWCLLAHACTWIPLGSIAQRVHFCSAFFAAATTFLTYWVAWRLTRHWVAALAAALALGFSGLLWSQAVIAEVYTLNAFLTILAVYCVIRWREGCQSRQWRAARHWLYGLALTAGLGLTNHPLLGLFLPVLAAWALMPYWRQVLPRRPATGQVAPWLPTGRLRVILVGMLLFLAGLSVYAYLPIRARANPAVNWDNPDTLAKTIRHIRRQAYTTEAERVRYVGTLKDAWRYSAAAVRECEGAFTGPLTIAALLGAAVLWKRRRDFLWVSLALIALNLVLLNVLLQSAFTPLGVFVHRVYYLPAQLMLALWLAGGCAWMFEKARRLSWVSQASVGLALAFCLLLPLAMHFPRNDRRDYRLARNFGLDLLASAPTNSGLLLLKDESLFVCAYLKTVEGLRPDVRLLDPFFGYRGESISAIMSDVQATPELTRYFPVLTNCVAVPWGLGYCLIKRDVAPPLTWQTLRSLGQPPHDPPEMSSGYDPFEADVRAAYACYHARRGARLALTGDGAGAETEFELSERLQSDDPYAIYLLAAIYDDLGLKRASVEPMLKRALASFELHYDPAAYRFYPIARDDIVSRLAQVRGENKP